MNRTLVVNGLIRSHVSVITRSHIIPTGSKVFPEPERKLLPDSSLKHRAEQ